MHFSRFKSIGAKLFYMTTLLVAMTVTGNSWQNVWMFNQHVARQVRESTIDASAERSAMIVAALDNFRNELGLGIHSALNTAQDLDRELALKAFLGVNTETVAIEIYREGSQRQLEPLNFAFTASPSTARFEGHDTQQIESILRDKLRERAEMVLANNKDRGVALGNLKQTCKVNMMLMMVPFQVQGATALHWAALVLWPSRFLAVLPHSELTRSKLVGLDGTSLVTTVDDSNLENSNRQVGFYRQALASGASGLKAYTDGSGESWLMAYTRLENYPAALIIEKNAKAEQLAAGLIVRRSALWGWAFVLVAILVSYFGASGITAQLRALTGATQVIAAGNLQAPVTIRGSDEVAVLATSVAFMAQRIEQLMGEQVSKAVMQKELETAQAVQSMLFPKAQKSSSMLRVEGFYQPATQCGGDWWGRFSCRDGSELLFVADATGHGAGPALVTAIAYTSFQLLPRIIEAESASGQVSPATLLQMFNELLFNTVGGSILMTFFVAHFDRNLGVLTYCNGGHTFPTMFRRVPNPAGGAATESYQEITLTGGGLPVGMQSEGAYRDISVQLCPGDIILFHTDGLIECTSPNGKPWGRKRMLKAAHVQVHNGAERLLAGLRADAFAYYQGTPLVDDVTIITAQVVDREPEVDEARLLKNQVSGT